MKVKVRVPATSANLGPGFDVAGLAVTLYNTFVFELLKLMKKFIHYDYYFRQKKLFEHQQVLKFFLQILFSHQPFHIHSFILDDHYQKMLKI